MPTPAGVPIEIMVPAFKAIPLESSLTTWSMPKISIDVLLSCRSSPFTLERMESFGG